MGALKLFDYFILVELLALDVVGDRWFHCHRCKSG